MRILRGHTPPSNSAMDRSSISSQTLHCLLLDLHSPTWMSVGSPLLAEAWRFSLRGRIAIHCYSGGHRWIGRWGWRRVGRGELALSTLPWSSSKLDKAEGLHVEAWLSWQCGDMCLRGRRRARDLLKMAW